MNIDIYSPPELLRELLYVGKHPQAEAYFDLAYRAVLHGDKNLASQYMSMTEEALHEGVAFMVIDGKKPLDEHYHHSPRPTLVVVPDRH
ncbi:MAG: hypothetical protein SWQ30_00765 [Thermodesulfobacteriota bacterium]|nr:hypothetical protein [Thermodesulfobacteriota bacterium]